MIASSVAVLAGAEPAKGPPSAPFSRYQIEFHARRTTNLQDSGHSFIVIRRTNDGGKPEVVRAAGFYPGRDAHKDRLEMPSPGEVWEKENIKPDDHVFAADITDEQARRANWVIDHWKNDKTYFFGIQDCVSLSMDVAVAVGLKIGDVFIPPGVEPVTGTLPVVTPERLIDALSNLNSRDSALKFAAEKSAETRRKQAADAARVTERLRRYAERVRTLPSAGKEASPANNTDWWELRTTPARRDFEAEIKTEGPHK